MTAHAHKAWIIYGAYGYTGELVVREALAQGQRPILAGRDKVKLAILAERYGLPVRSFGVLEAHEHLTGARLLLNCAGPFVDTATPMMDACLAHRLHYLDVTGEIAVFQAAHGRREAARQAGVILCPGVGFDIVPTDCLAALLKQALPEASHLELGFSFGTLPSMGTIRTAMRNVGQGGLVRENQELRRVPLGHRIRNIPFSRGKQWTVSLPWGDVFTSQISTGIPNAIVFGALPLPACWLVKLAGSLRRLLARQQMQHLSLFLADKLIAPGPNHAARDVARSSFWGRATSPDGRECTATIDGPSAYSLTAETAVAIASCVETCDEPGGYYTASMLVGADFLSHRKGYNVRLLST